VKITRAFVLVLVCCVLATGGQMPSRPNISPSVLDQAGPRHPGHPAVKDEPRPIRWRIDRAQAKREAEELAKLAQEIPAQIGLAEKGAVSKDLSENLKKIQKLSKRLRSELAL